MTLSNIFIGILIGFVIARFYYHEKARKIPFQADAEVKNLNTNEVASTPQKGSHPDQAQQLKDLIQSGQKIQAIKLYRAIHGVGLREAKEAVEEMGG